MQRRVERECRGVGVDCRVNASPLLTSLPCPALSSISSQLCSEDYHWWWRAYFTSGASALYLFAYSIFYFYSKLDISNLVAMLMYWGYMALISYGFFCLTGTIGFLSTYVFVSKIFGSVKVRETQGGVRPGGRLLGSSKDLRG